MYAATYVTCLRTTVGMSLKLYSALCNNNFLQNNISFHNNSKFLTLSSTFVRTFLLYIYFPVSCQAYGYKIN